MQRKESKSWEKPSQLAIKTSDYSPTSVSRSPEPSECHQTTRTIICTFIHTEKWGKKIVPPETPVFIKELDGKETTLVLHKVPFDSSRGTGLEFWRIVLVVLIIGKLILKGYSCDSKKMSVMFFVFSLCAVLVVCEDTYTSKYDNFNVVEAMKNDRLYRGYFNCLADRGPCTREGYILKEALPDGLKNNCSKCTEHQRRGTHQVMRYLFKNRPEDMAVLEEIYDPEGIYRTKYAEERQKLME